MPAGNRGFEVLGLTPCRLLHEEAACAARIRLEDPTWPTWLRESLWRGPRASVHPAS